MKEEGFKLSMPEGLADTQLCYQCANRLWEVQNQLQESITPEEYETLGQTINLLEEAQQIIYEKLLRPKCRQFQTRGKPAVAYVPLYLQDFPSETD